MAHDIPEGCEKYMILTIVNPGVYWMAKNRSTEHYKKVIQQLQFLLSKNVRKVVSAEEISVGKMVAVKIETEFHRGLVRDIFYRNTMIKYLVLLIDYGSVIEINQNKIYLIKDQKLINKEFIGIEVSVNGIQPAALDLKSEAYFLDGIFHKRVQNNWSIASHKYVQELFNKNSLVFVKPHQVSGINILGDIFFSEEPGKILISLAQKLCEAGFAVFSKVKPKFFEKVDLEGREGCKDVDIEQKIQNKSNSLGIRLLNSAHKLHKNATESSTSSHTANTSIDLDSHSKIRDSEKEHASNVSSPNTNENEKCTLSSSWILKKHFPISLPHSGHNFFNKNEIFKSEKTPSLDL